MSDQAADTEDDDSLPPRKPRIASRRDVHQSGWGYFAQDPDDPDWPTTSDRSPNRSVGYVSIWIGSLADRESLELYVKQPTDSFNLEEGEEEFCPLWDDLGFSVVESVATKFHATPGPAEDLITGLSGADLFRESLVAACRDLGIDSANAAIAVFGLDCDGPPSLCCGRLAFVGSFMFC